jgi:hypothetical protein
MLLNIVIAALMMIVTTGVHAGGMILAIFIIRSHGRDLRNLSPWKHIYWLSGIILIMFLVSLLEVMAWALTYLVLNAIQGVEQAVYFSMVTFTTLGYGDITLNESWRLLGSFQAANGIIMFGWTTAIVVAAVQQIYFSHKAEEKG